MTIQLGDTLPNLTLKATGDTEINLAALQGKNVVIYFYPKDDTPGCTTEAQGFRDHLEKFKKFNTVVLGVSRDSVKSHDKFTKKYDLTFQLLSDEDEKLCQLFDVIKSKNMYGKIVQGIERSTFLFDQHSKLIKEWRKVKVDGHVSEVLSTIAQESKS